MSNIITIGKPGSKGSKKMTVNGDTIKLAPMRRSLPVYEALGKFSKGEARVIRKALRNNGFPGLAGSERIAA